MRLAIKRTLAPQTTHFTPTLLGDLTHWYKYNTTILESDESEAEDEDAVTKWGDSKGTNHLLAEENSPIFVGSDNSLSFDDENKIMSTTAQITLDGNFAVYIRMKFASPINSNDVLVKDSDSSTQFFRVQNSGAFKAKLGGSALDWTIGATIGTSAYHNIGIERTGTALRTYLDGTESTTTNVTSSGNMLIDRLKGGLGCFVTQLIIVKGSSLTALERADLNTYLNNYSS